MNAARKVRSIQRGLSLVELMVGIAVGLVILAAASIMVVSQLTDNRRLLLETQVQQDLRITADIIVRDLRRAGHAGVEWPSAMWAGTGSLPSGYAPVSPAAGTATALTFSYRDASGEPRSAGYRHNGYGIQSLIGTWQDLTDRVSLKVTRFEITAEPNTVVDTDAGTRLPCARLCPPLDTTDCWPTFTVRKIKFEIDAEAVHDANVKHTLGRTVTLRNDGLDFNDPLNPNRVCPP